MFCFTFLLIFFSLNIQANDDSFRKIDELGRSPKWHKLLHYKKSSFGNYSSQEDGTNFFYSNEGKYDPVLEIKSFFQAVKDFKSTDTDTSPQCRFPARYQFLKENIGINYDLKCPKLEEWYAAMAPDSLSIIYASNYPQNPISIFGHTFLRINSKKNGTQKNDLLDYAVGFAAQTPPDISGTGYIYKGLFGGFGGEFSTVPYYLKTKEYNNLENRDIWEYELNLNADETKMVVWHLWELGNFAKFNYYFFDEN